MSGYKILLFDNDGTLMDFEKAQEQALKLTCGEMGAPYGEEVRDAYSRINDGWWKRMEKGECLKDELQIGRFADFTRAFAFPGDPVEWNRRYMENLGKGSFLLPQAEEVCCVLSRRYRLYVVTNGVAVTQYRRIQHSAYFPYIQGIFVSEEAGAPKPSRAYFDYVFSRLPGEKPEDMLLIGDSPSADLLGANRAGIDCCWYNPGGLDLPAGVFCSFQIRSLSELIEKLA